MKHLLKGLISFLLLFSTLNVFGQTKNAIYFELLGNGGLYSLNYEKNLSEKLIARVGFGYVKQNPKYPMTVGNIYETEKYRVFYTPVLIAYTIGMSKHFFEIGSGFLIGHESYIAARKTQVIVNMTGFAGYRYEAERGFLLKFGITPHYVISPEENALINTFWYSGGLSLGYHF